MTFTIMSNIQDIGPRVVTRLSLALLFLWFGLKQVLAPADWTPFLPTWIGFLPLEEVMLVRLHGIFEVTAGALLMIGAYARVSAFLLGANLAVIAMYLGGPIGVRDGALALVTLMLAAEPTDRFTLDARFSTRNTKSGR